MGKIVTQHFALDAGKTTWFEADKLTLAEIKLSYVFGAKEFIYFRKGEDWLKELVDWYIAWETLGNIGVSPYGISFGWFIRFCGYTTLHGTTFTYRI